jgi:hypothetical protein
VQYIVLIKNELKGSNLFCCGSDVKANNTNLYVIKNNLINHITLLFFSLKKYKMPNFKINEKFLKNSKGHSLTRNSVFFYT